MPFSRSCRAFRGGRLSYRPEDDARAPTPLKVGRIEMPKSLAISADERYKSAFEELYAFVGTWGYLGHVPKLRERRDTASEQFPVIR